MRISLLLLPLLMGLVVLGCSDSHGRDDDASVDGASSCSGPVPAFCPRVRAEGGPTCCDGVGESAECGPDGAWRCPLGTIDVSSCTGSWVADRCGLSAPECDVPSQCLLRPESCCGSCGAATPDDMIAIPLADQAAYVDMVCGGGTIGCPECAARQDPYLLATCRDRRCTAIDLHVDPLTECASASDCTLAPLQCCACGLLGMDQVVAFNPAHGSIGALVCDPDADCPPCVPDFGSITATCEAGRCVVVP